MLVTCPDLSHKVPRYQHRRLPLSLLTLTTTIISHCQNTATHSDQTSLRDSVSLLSYGNPCLELREAVTSIGANADAMYYPQQSPGISHKLANHHDQNSWPRPHHSVLGPPGQQPNVGPPPPSPGYAIYTNGNVNPMQHHPHHPHPLPPMQHHHHQNSLSHYPSPPNGHTMQQHVLSQSSPASSATQVISPHWQQQLLKCEVCSPCIYTPC
jgi:hypothetical protein